MVKTNDAPTSREVQRLATRERLFEAAVVATADVAHGTFFFHFPTKEHVVAELGHREEVHLTGLLERFLRTPRDLKSTLDEVVRLSLTLERRLGPLLFNDMIALYFSPKRPEL